MTRADVIRLVVGVYGIALLVWHIATGRLG